MISYVEVRGTDRKVITLIRNFTSLIWKTEYNNTGAFELVVPYSKEYFEILQPDNYITRVDSTEIGFIESVKMHYSTKEGRMITASGRFGLVLLERRLFADILGDRYICATQELSSVNTPAEMVCEIVDKTLVNATWGRRKINWLSIETPTTLETTLHKYESVNENALELSKTILNEALFNGFSSPLGQRIEFDRSAKTATYKVFKGRNRNIVFSEEYKNLLSLDYSYDKTLYKTGFLIKGSEFTVPITYNSFPITIMATDPEKNDFYTYADRGATSAEQQAQWYEKRREYLFESQKNKTYNDSAGNEHEYSNSDYSDILKNDCKAHFSDTAPLEKISGTVNLDAYKLGVDYSVGDTATLEDKKMGISTTVRIWAVTEVQDSNGYTVDADFEGGM